MIFGVSGLPFPRSRLPVVRDLVIHGHYRARNVGVPLVNVTRDGRDLLTPY